jgi:outer membrane protein assembly factor BamD
MASSNVWPKERVDFRTFAPRSIAPMSLELFPLRAYWVLLAVVAGLAVQGCDPCRKLAKSPDIALKDSAAYCYYDRKLFESAAVLFEELMNYHSNNPRGENMMFMFAQSRMRNGEFITGAAYFQFFIQKYPLSTLVEEATYNIGYCHYLLSNDYELDQRDTEKALEFFTLFQQVYTTSDRLPKVREMEAELKAKLAFKAFRQARLYLITEHYKSAVIALQQFMIEYPDSKYREEALFGVFKAQYLYAQKSVVEKQAERYREAEQYYLKFVDRFPSGAFSREAENVFDKLKRELLRVQGTTATR